MGPLRFVDMMEQIARIAYTTVHNAHNIGLLIDTISVVHVHVFGKYIITYMQCMLHLCAKQCRHAGRHAKPWTVVMNPET